MSKQSEAKAAQGYESKPIPSTCANCANYKSDWVMKHSEWMATEWKQESNIRCGIGGFAVKKMGTCNQFLVKDAK